MRPVNADVPPFRFVATVLRRRWLLVLGAGALGAAAGIVVAAVVPPTYTAKAQLVIDAQAATIGNVIDDAAVDTRVEMLMSDGHLRQMLKSLDHAANPAASTDTVPAPSMTDRIELLRTKLMARLAPFTGASGSVAVPPEKPETDLAALSLDDLQKSINVYRERRSRVISVTYRSRDPVAAAAMANTGVEVYVDDLRSQRAKSRLDTLRRLEERIPEAKVAMEAAEGTLRRFASAHGLLADGDAGDEDLRIAEINRQLAIARFDLAERSHGPEATKGPGGDGGANSSTFQTTARSGPMPLYPLGIAGHPGTLAGMAAPFAASAGRPETATDAAGADMPDSDVLAARVRYLERWQSRLQSVRAQTLEAELAYRDLVRNAASALQVYDALLRRQADLLTQESRPPEARVLSLAAPPEKPSSPDTLLFILPATLFACLSGGLVALILERGNHTLRSPSLVGADGRSPETVLLPHVGRLSGQRGALARLGQPFSAYTGAVRLLSAQMTIETGPDGEESCICLVTSSGPGEGKTTLAISLAAYLRTIDRKVLLVDMDFRRPGLAPGFDAARGNGILDLLRGTPPGEIIARHEGFGIDYLPLPVDRIDPMLVLADRELDRVMRDLRGQYDVVVIDGSPMAGTADARLILPLVDRVVLASRWGRTLIEDTRTALARLHDLQMAERTELVMTMVPLRRYERHHYREIN